MWNGQKGLVVNEKGDAILLISSCSNCGDYNIIPIDNLNMVIKKYKKQSNYPEQKFVNFGLVKTVRYI